MQTDKIIGFSTMSSAIKNADNYTRWIVSSFNKYIGDAVLEVGVGHGNYKSIIRTKFYCSVDIDKHVIEEAQKQDINGHYIEVDVVSPSFVQKTKDIRVDTIILVNVLEHIEDDKIAINNLLSLLTSGGHLIIFVPAFQSLFSNMDNLAGHFKRYTKKSVMELMQSFNLKIIKNEYFNPIGGIGWWVNKHLKHNNLDSKIINNQIAIFDKYIVPISKMFNPITKSFFGQSLLVVIKKTDHIL